MRQAAIIYTGQYTVRILSLALLSSPSTLSELFSFFLSSLETPPTDFIFSRITSTDDIPHYISPDVYHHSPDPSDPQSSLGAPPLMAFRARRVSMRPAREFDVVLRARDQQVSTLQEQTKSLRAQLEASERRLANTRANAHADARTHQLQDRRIEQLRSKLRDTRFTSAAQRRELDDVKREVEAQRVELAEAHEENARYLTRIAELEAALQATPSQPRTDDASKDSMELGDAPEEDFLDALTQLSADLEAMGTALDEDLSVDCLPESAPESAPVDYVEVGLQTSFDDHPDVTHSSGGYSGSEDVKELESLILELRNASEEDQRRIRELEVDLEHSRHLIEEFRFATEEERRRARELQAASVRTQARVTSLEDAATEDQRTMKALEDTIEDNRAEIDSLEAQATLLRTLLDESRSFNDDLEESHDALMLCKDAFIEDLRERISAFAASEAWHTKREAALQDAQEKLAAADNELMELRLELEGAQRNAVTSTNRIIQLEAEASVARHRMRTADAEILDLREEVGMAVERMGALEDELFDAQERLDNAEGNILQLHQELEDYISQLSEVSDSLDEGDSVSEEGSIDTLVVDADDPQFISGSKDINSSISLDDDEFSIDDTASLRSLELRLEAMTLKYKAAEAARVCGDDIEDMLRAKLQALFEDNEALRVRLSAASAPLAQHGVDSPIREAPRRLPSIAEEEELDIPPPAILRAVRPPLRIEPVCGTKSAPSIAGSIRGPNTAPTESPLVPSPTLSDVWFASTMRSLALAGESERTMLDWDLPSPGGDSDNP
ncbi:hypothetical protein BC834DRAFT_360249 [Gloeopeniophorella convolvens]|nr:hypothetical protein BC834DRAFT_360249 [Gloeopeniophorella convolvens]